MDEKKVKGSMLLDFVRMIRSNKNLEWDKHLKPEDWDIVNSIVLPAKWYPFGFYQRCSNAAFMILAKSNVQAARMNGQRMAKHLFETTYKTTVQGKDPGQSLKTFVSIYGGFFNFSTLKFESVDAKHVKVQHFYESRDIKGTEAYCHQLQGMFETMVEMTGGKNGKVVLATKQWQGAKETTFDVTWE